MGIGLRFPSSLVVVDNLDHPHCFDEAPVESAIRAVDVRGARCEDQALSAFEFQCKLASAVAVKFVAASREPAKLLQSTRGTKVGQSCHQLLRASVPVYAAEVLLRFEEPLQPSRCEGKLHALVEIIYRSGITFITGHRLPRHGLHVKLHRRGARPGLKNEPNASSVENS